MKDLRHDNVNQFIGACVDPPHFLLIIEYCSKGSLQVNTLSVVSAKGKHSSTNKIDTEIKGYVKGVESSSIYTIRAVMLYMSEVLEVSKVYTGLSILMSKVSKVAQYTL